VKQLTKYQLWIVIFALFGSGLVSGLDIAEARHRTPVISTSDAAADPNARTEPGTPDHPLKGFAPLVKQVLPAIVNIASVAVVKTNSGQEFPGLPFDWPPDLQMPREHRERSAGSGVIVSPDGYILTNSHVVDGAIKVKVSLSDKREFTARVVGADDKSDIALLKIDAANLPVLPLGDSSRVQAGDIVLAIGNPYGLGQTVTMGIVSAVGRGNLGIEDYEDFIQTDAAINPGNSGGALTDTRGELIGINTAILSNGTGGNQGIGFAIPSNMARKIMTDIKEHGQVTRGWLGLEIQDMNSALAAQFRVKDSKGALVSGVDPRGPAARAGIQRGDVLREIAGKTIDDSRDLRLQVAETPPGTAVEAKILRNGAERSLSITVGTMPAERKSASIEEPASGGKIGVAVEDMSPQVAQEAGVPPSTGGVIIVDVQSDSPAAESGLQVGDIVQEVNRKAIETVSEFKSAISDSPNTILLFINRGGHTLYTVVNRNA
jgi:serine protease Do